MISTSALKSCGQDRWAVGQSIPTLNRSDRSAVIPNTSCDQNTAVGQQRGRVVCARKETHDRGPGRLGSGINNLSGVYNYLIRSGAPNNEHPPIRKQRG